MRGKEVKSILPQDYDVTNDKSVFMERKCKDTTINRMLTDTAYELGAGGRERPPRTHNHHPARKSYARFLKSTIQDEAKKPLDL